MNYLVSIFAPNRDPGKTGARLLIAGQVLLFLLFWNFGTAEVIPKPLEVWSAWLDLWRSGFVAELYTSLSLYGEAILLAVLFSWTLATLTALAFFRPIATVWGNLRFASMAGLPFFLTLYIAGAHNLKLALLVFSTSVFMVVSQVDVLTAIPKEKYDLARTLRMNEWEVIWEVGVLGRVDLMLDVFRQTAAMTWFMLPLVEALFRSEGGIGTVLANQDRHMHLAAIAAIQLTVLAIGLLQDWLFTVIKGITCPYAKLLLERK